jgi:outer membrane autotransporter protein
MIMTKKRSHLLRVAVARAMSPLWPSMFAVAAAVVPFDASVADDECGIYAPGVELVCDPASNPHADGVRYSNVTDDILLRIPTGVTITTTPSAFHGVDVFGPGYSFSVVAEEGAAIEVAQAGYSGIKLTGAAEQSILSSANVTAPYMGLRGEVNDAASSSSISITQLQPGSIRITGDNGAGMAAEQRGTGTVTVINAGRIESNAIGTYGMYADGLHANGGAVTLTLEQTGVIDLTGDLGAGVYAITHGGGSTNAIVKGAINISGGSGLGAVAYGTPTATGDAFAEVTSTGSLVLDGDDSIGLWSVQGGLGNSRAESAGVITTSGERSPGILISISGAASTATATGVVSGGTITTYGAESTGVDLSNRGTGAGTIQLLSDAQVRTYGASAHGVSSATGGTLAFAQSQASVIAVQGAEAIGANFNSGSDLTAQIQGAVSGSGQFGIGVATNSGTGTAQLTIEPTATVTGGWQADAGSVGATTGAPAAGVRIVTDTAATLTNRGTIGAAADRALYAEGLGAATIDNFGTITGFATFTNSGANVFNNASTFALRHFADTDGDGARDTKRVAISDFGAATSVFNNASGAVVKLAEVASATTTDATSYYVPTTGVDLRALDGSVYDLNRAGIVQGQFVNLGTFNHSGVIDLRGPQTGNTLVMTGAATAGGAPGSGVFVSNGGTLLLNVALNAGIAPGGQSGSIADVLIVDGTQMGAGATSITLDRKEGSGALTPGNGILLVEVRDKTRSAADVFTLNGDYTHNGLSSVVVGAYAYSLFHNGTGSDTGDGNWYLRSSMLDLEPTDPTDPSDPTDPIDPTDPTVPADPSTPPDLVAPSPPRFQPGVPLYESYALNLQALNMLPTLQQRVGNRVWSATADQESTGVWGRTSGASSRARAVTSPSGAEHAVDAWKMQLGLDHLAVTSDNGNRLVTSLAVEYGQADSSIHSIFGNGQLDTESYGLGTMWTWYRHTGLYVDVQAQVNRYSSDLRSSLLGQLVRGNDGRGEAFSVELGKVVSLGDEWSVTPQAQLSYSNVRFNRFVDPTDAVVSTHDADSRISRAGIAVNRDYEVHERRNHWYGIANLSYEWGNGLHANVSGVQLRRMDRRTWGEIGLGGSINWNNGVRLYGEVSGKSPLHDIGDSYTFHGTLGLSVQF